MTNTIPLYGSSKFVGREKQLDVFRNLLESSEHKKWILYLKGEGGIGKTKLLEQFSVEAREFARRHGVKLFYTADMIDFYWTKNQRILGILENIAQQLSPDVFERFLEEVRKEPDSKLSTIPLQVEKTSIPLFIECYQKLASQDLILLLFDTLEMCEPWLNTFWIDVFPQLSTNTIVIFAGRPYRNFQDEQLKRSRFDEILKLLPSEQIQEIPMDYFNLKLTKEYLNDEGIKTSPALIRKLHDLTEGKPILLALTCDWIRIHGGSLSELLEDKTRIDFQIDLVRGIQSLDFGQNQAILAMSFFYRRFDEDLMSFVFNQDLHWAKQVLSEVSQYSFVKYRKSRLYKKLGSSLLHDEMRKLIEEYVWPIVDPSGQQKQYWSEKILPYYDMLIGQSEVHSERFILQLEKLHYMLERNPVDCYDFLASLLRESFKAQNDVDARMINAEIESYAKRLSVKGVSLLRFYQAWITTKTTGDFTSSIEELLRIEEEHTLDVFETNQLYHWLATALAANGQLERAKQYAYRALDNLKAREVTLPDDSVDQDMIQEGVGGIYNSLGLIARREGNLDLAIQSFETALNTNISWAFRAIVENNLSYVLLVSGDARRAEKVCRRALDRRRQMNVPNELGLSYNVMGMILTDLGQNGEAYTCFEQALSCFEQGGNKRGEAISLIGLGRLLRRWGKHKEFREYDGFEKVCQQYYQSAIQKLKKACDILESQDDRFTYAEALDELGCAYRENRLFQDARDTFESAYKIFEKFQTKPKMADSLQNIAMVFQYENKWDLALEYAEKVEALARETSSFYIFSKAKWTLGDVAFNRGDFQRAFREYSQAGILLAQPSSDSTMYDSRAREMVFEDLLKHIKQKIFDLKSSEDVKDICNRLFQDWSEVGLKERDEYAEFLVTIQSWPEEFLYATHK